MALRGAQPALQLFGYAIDRYDHVFTYDGLPTRRKLEVLSRDSGLPTALHPFINELKQSYTAEIAHLRCRPNFQHEYALSRLKADGYQLAVASNSIRGTVELLMEKARLRRLPHPDDEQRGREGPQARPGDLP